MLALKNAWYAAGWPDEIDGAKLLGRTLLNTPVVMFRTRDGTAVAIDDRCPHRFAPLHLGRHVGDAVQCGYHGLEFAADGRCVRNPHGACPKTSVATYPMAEKYGVLWIWMGQGKADEKLISPAFEFVGDQTRDHIKGYLHVQAHYLLLVDNLMDLSHGLYLHQGTLATVEMQQGFDPKVYVDGDVVHSDREQPNIEPPAIFAASIPAGVKRIDYFSNNEWHPPSNVIHPVGCRPLGQPMGSPGEVASRSAHLFTPETDTSSHYFYTNSRPGGQTTPEVIEKVRKLLHKVFGSEDRPMIEAQQRMIGDVDLMSLRPVVLPSDKAAVMVRQRLKQMIAKEQANVRTEPAGATD